MCGSQKLTVILIPGYRYGCILRIIAYPVLIEPFLIFDMVVHLIQMFDN